MIKCDILIAGSGIAGLSAALTAARLGRSTVALTGAVLGGQLLSVNKIDGYPGFTEGVPGYDLCPMVQEQAITAGAELRMIELVDLGQGEDRWCGRAGDGGAIEARAVIVATGARLKKLGIPGEERLFGKGVSHCASCDAPLLKRKTVVVVGGGDSALQEALTLAEQASRITVVHRGATLTAQKAYRDTVAAQSRIELCGESEVEEILGDANVTGVRLRDGTEIAASGVFVYIGLEPNSTVAPPSVLDDARAILTDASMRSALPGLAAAGAVRAGWSGRAAAAAGEGAAAAIAIDHWLCDKRWREV
jgi:thioredoxin reductase (NADPH)